MARENSIVCFRNGGSSPFVKGETILVVEVQEAPSSDDEGSLGDWVTGVSDLQLVKFFACNVRRVA